MNHSENIKSIIKWNPEEYDPNTIGIILIVQDGQILYGKKNQNYQYRNMNDRISHMDIFGDCISELEINLSCYDQMDYAYGLASDKYNIISIQIITVDSMPQIIVVLNLNSTEQQLDVLNDIMEIFNRYGFSFSADICYGNNIKAIYDESSNDKIDLSLQYNEFKRRFKDALSELKEKTTGRKV